MYAVYAVQLQALLPDWLQQQTAVQQVQGWETQ